MDEIHEFGHCHVLACKIILMSLLLDGGGIQKEKGHLHLEFVKHSTMRKRKICKKLKYVFSLGKSLWCNLKENTDIKED